MPNLHIMPNGTSRTRRHRRPPTSIWGLCAIAALVLVAPVLAGAQSEAKKVGGIWTGTWKTDFGTVRLVQDGETVTGTVSPGGARLEAKASGLELKGVWKPAPAAEKSSGSFGAALREDGRSLTAGWVDTNGDWGGKRTTALPAPLRSLEMILFKKRYVPHTAYVADGARIKICNRDDFNHKPLSLSSVGKLDGVFLRSGQCTSLVVRNKDRALRLLKLYDGIHSQERAVIVVRPAGRIAPVPVPLTWVLARTTVNPTKWPPPQGASVTARAGHLDWQVLVAPQVDWDVDYPAPPNRLTPGSKLEIPIRVAGRITGGRDTQGYRAIAVILYMNDRWVGDAVGDFWQNCVDPIGSAPISCTPPVNEQGVLGFTVPTPGKSGDTFTFGIGTLNCSACTVRFEYTAR